MPMDYAANLQSLAHVPPPGAERIAMRVSPAAERAIQDRHPWLFADGITKQRRDGRAGDVAVVFDSRDRFLAAGLYDPHSPIRVRLLVHGRAAALHSAFLRGRIHASAERRTGVAATSDGYRVVHGENDGLGGLVVDRYRSTLVIKLYSGAWMPHLRAVVAALIEILAPERIVLRLNRSSREHREDLFGLDDGQVLFGPAPGGPVTFRENGLEFFCDPVRGQKTGFFLDQRDNRARVERVAAGRDVLNVCAYTGGFSLYAARGGARAVTSVDLSQPALDDAARNFHLNSADPRVRAASHEMIAGDAFDVLDALRQGERRFGLVILDPPSFAKKSSEVPAALAAYQRLARAGLGVLSPGGILAAASCSSRVAAGDFFAAIHAAASRGGRTLVEIERTFHPADHPIGYPLGAYLKCLFGRVD